MAEIITNKDLDKQKKTSGTTVNPASTGPSPNQNPASKQGSGFTNIQKFVSANQGNKVGQAVTGGFQNQVGGTLQNVKSSEEGFKKQAQQGATVIGDAEKNRLQGILADPTKATDEDQAFVQKYRDASYTGPQQLQNQQQLQGQVQQAQQLGNMAKDPGQRQNLLQQFVGQNKVYRSGQQLLDNQLQFVV